MSAAIMDNQLQKIPFPELAVRVEKNSLSVTFPEKRLILSNGLLNGGLFNGQSLLNHGASNHPDDYEEITTDPAKYLAQLAQSLGLIDPVATMTAVEMKDLIVEQECYADGHLCLLITGGVTNAVRAGDPAEWKEAAGIFEKIGTINIILLTNLALVGRTLVDCVQVITEGKSAALQELQVKSTVTANLATGTGTDTVMVVSGLGTPITYGGTHSLFGEILGRLTIKGVKRALTKTREMR